MRIALALLKPDDAQVFTIAVGTFRNEYAQKDGAVEYSHIYCSTLIILLFYNAFILI